MGAGDVAGADWTIPRAALATSSIPSPASAAREATRLAADARDGGTLPRGAVLRNFVSTTAQCTLCAGPASAAHRLSSTGLKGGLLSMLPRLRNALIVAITIC